MTGHAPVGDADWLVTMADRSLAEVLREEARHAPGGTVVEEGGVLLCGGSGPLPVNPNAVMRTDPGTPAADVLARADAFYSARGAGYSLHLRLGDVDDDLAAAARAGRLLHDGAAPALVVEAPCPPARPAAGPVALRRVTSAADARDYAGVVDDAYQSLGWPAGGPAAVFAHPGLLIHPCKEAFVARIDGVPAAAAYVSVTDGLGGVSWVGTTSAARGRGLASLVTVAATNAGFAMGARAVWLVASEMGEPVYRRLGFRPFGATRTLMRWPDRAPAADPGH